MDGWMDGWMGGWIDGRMDGCISCLMCEHIFTPSFFTLMYGFSGIEVRIAT